ncbi:ABC transporter permease [Nannocystaceae bacterium ST9]
MNARPSMLSWFRAVLVVWRKELLDGVRDRRSLFSTLLYPLFGPLLSGLLFGFIADQQREAGDVPIPIAGAEYAPELVEWLEVQGATVVDAPEDPQAAVRAGEVPCVVAVPEEFGERMAVGEPIELELIVDGSRNDNRAAVAHVEKQLDSYSYELSALRLLARGVDPAIMSAVKVRQVEVASEQQLATSLFSFVPLFVLLATFVGGMQMAIDTTAGERERGSLEPLLLNPVPRSAIVVGKWLATVMFALACVLLTLVCCVFVLEYTPVRDLGMQLALGPGVLLGIVLVTVPMALLASAMQMTVASFARSFKEAQTYISLLMFVPMVPAMVSMMSGLGDSLAAAAIPVVGQQMLIEQAFGGESPSVLAFVLAGGSAVALALACVAVTAWLFRRESIVFGR